MSDTELVEEKFYVDSQHPGIVRGGFFDADGGIIVGVRAQWVCDAMNAFALSASKPCSTCNDTGQYPVGTSGDDSDGNAIAYETCPECGYGDSASKGKVVISREVAEDTLSLYRAKHVEAVNNDYTKASIHHYTSMITIFEQALKEKE